MSMLNYGLIYEQLPPFLAIGVMGHECTIARIFAEATEEQKEMFLPELFEGKKITGTATTEPGVGSNPREVATRVVEDGNELVINGRMRPLITNSLPSSTTRVATSRGFEPTPGSVVAVPVIFLPSKSSGRNISFCSSVASAKIRAMVHSCPMTPMARNGGSCS